MTNSTDRILYGITRRKAKAYDGGTDRGWYVMLNLKLRIMYRAIVVRLHNGEQIEAILQSYNKLSEEETSQLLNSLKENKEVE